MNFLLPHPNHKTHDGKHRIVEMFDKQMVLTLEEQPELIRQLPSLVEAIKQGKLDLARESRAVAIQVICVREDRSVVLIQVRRTKERVLWNFGIHPKFVK